MHRLSYAFLAGLIGAGLVHIALVFALPSLLPDAAWDRLSQAGGLYETVSLETAAGRSRLLAQADPAVLAIACRFDLRDGMVRVRAQGGVPFWSASIYDRDGANVYSLNDRSTARGDLDFIVLTPERMDAMRASRPADVDRAVHVEAAVDQGIVVVRAVLPDPTFAGAVEAFLASARCASMKAR